MEKIKFSITTNKKKGLLEIHIKCVQGVKSSLVDTGVRVFSDEWDDENGVVISNPNSKNLNKVIRKCVYDLQDIEFSTSDQGMTLSKLIKIWNNKDSYFDFYVFFEQHIKDDGVKESTSRLHKNTLYMLKKYNSSCLISELDEDFIDGFLLFLKNHTFLDGRHYDSTTIKRHLSILRSYYNKAKRLFPKKVNYIDFSRYKIKINDKPIKSLEESDIKLLEKLVFCEKNNKDELVIDQFLFMSYTGVRYSDFITLNDSNFIKDGDTLWMCYTSVKTSISVKLPINLLFDGRGEQLLYKYKDRLKRLFSIPDNSTWNRKLKRIASKYGIKKKISAHVARHTFATRLLANKVPLPVIQKVIGHRNPETTMVYAKVTDNTLLSIFSGINS